jgi:secondary thiamine-phosphate synthase enzyme
MVVCVEKSVQTRGQGDAQDVTAAVQETIESSGLTVGMATVFVRGSTAGVTTMEFEAGVVHDVDAALGRLAPREGDYRHHLRWGDDNGSSHVRAALVGPTLSVPFQHGRLLLGTWQQIVLLEFDTSPRRRGLVIQLQGEQGGKETGPEE